MSDAVPGMQGVLESIATKMAAAVATAKVGYTSLAAPKMEIAACPHPLPHRANVL